MMLRAIALSSSAIVLAWTAHCVAQDEERDGGLIDTGRAEAGAQASNARVKTDTYRDAADPERKISIETQLQSMYAQIARFEDVRVSEAHGVVSLSGKVQSGEDAEAAVALAEKVAGVLFVENNIREPMAVSDRISPIRDRFEAWLARGMELAPLVGLAMLLWIAFLFIGRVLSGRDFIFERLVRKPILRDVARRLTRLFFTVLGTLVALEIVGATGVVGTILGAAGVLGLAVGFAFRDIAENYLASLLLIGRRPFAIGDWIQIEDQEGKVMRLTMRETVLMTLDGNHLSLPNAAVFKARVLNFTRNPRRRFDFVVGAGVDVDLLRAQQLGTHTLLGTPGVIDTPEPLAQIEALGDSNVAIRFFGWVDQREADYLKVRSEAIRRVKTALDDAGIDMPEPIYRVNLRQEPEKSVAKKDSEPIEADVDLSPDEAIDREIDAHKNEEKNLIDS